MINILIDSNIYISKKYNVFSGPLRSLKKYSDKGIIKLFTNDIINREVSRHLSKDLSEEVNSIVDKINKSSMLQVVLRCGSCNIIDDLEKLKTDMALSLNSYLSCATEIKNDSVSLEKIMRQYFDVVAPFEDNEKKKNEFPDAIIIESIKLRDNRDELLYVITDDHGWANAFPEGNEYNVKVIDDIYTMTTQVAQVLLDNDILSNIQNELKDQLLEKVKTWLEDYDYTDIAENIDDGVIECDELDSATIKSINLFFNGIDYVDREDRTATLDFSVESSVEINYSYIDHSEETYDREDDVYYNTKHGEATSIINLTIPMEVFVTVLEITDENKDNILDIDDIDFDSIDIKHIETNYEEDIDYEDEPFAYLNVCPDCGQEITEANDGGNGFCNICAPNH